MDEDFFLRPSDPMQKRYEALRASFVDGLSTREVARRFGYSIHTVHALRRDFKADSLPPFFRPLARGPTHTATPFYAQVERSHHRTEETELLHRGD